MTCYKWVTIFTWLNANTSLITLGLKIDAATIQMWPLLNTQKQCLYIHEIKIHCDTNQVWQLFKVQCLTK